MTVVDVGDAGVPSRLESKLGTVAAGPIGQPSTTIWQPPWPPSR